MKKLLVALILGLALPVQSAENVTMAGAPGALLDAVALNAAASALTFYIGPRIQDASPTSSTSTTSGSEVKGFDKVRLEINYDYGATTVALTLTCTEGQTRAASAGKITTATYSSGAYTLEWAGVVTSPSMSADTVYQIEFLSRHAQVIKCVVSSSGSPGATDKVTVTGWLIKE